MSLRDEQRERVRAYFAANPDASVNQCARHLNNRGEGIHRNEIAAFRRELASATPAAPPPQPAPPAPIEQTMPADPHLSASTLRQRYEFAADLFDKRPDMHPDEAATLLRARFGKAIGVEMLYALARDARTDAGVEQLPVRDGSGGKRPLDVQGMPALEALRAVALALKGIPDVDVELTLRGGKVELKYSLIATGKLEV